MRPIEELREPREATEEIREKIMQASKRIGDVRKGRTDRPGLVKGQARSNLLGAAAVAEDLAGDLHQLAEQAGEL